MLHKIQIDKLEVNFHGEEILKDLSFSVPAGQMFAIIGPNGAGKSTLLKSILGLVRPQHGSVSIAGDPKKTVIGYVPQSRIIDEETPINAKDFVSLGLISRMVPWLSRQEKKGLKEIMRFTDTERLAKKPIGKLSGGERQRVFLAQALVRRPDLLLLDESTANLDPDAQVRMMALVKKAVKEWGVTVLFISHDLRLVRDYADQVLIIARGFYKTGATETILDDAALLKQVFELPAEDAGSGRDPLNASEMPLSASSS
ncbi:metal ABC transporter ATP-binding protein [Sporolactobacillus sp. CPB3-1]|uniref:Metal ABC transporter ATP-binding protein n=1 Tax=Sporolactobacillus mangiferae TaxID=2940498 RepID=A0ABT0M7C1_9BACL|nr:metal ABC transporter ATP-binding protein [Sporolactobacillus mangiferae]MCL1630755.1 metal ABC transporter ATP-binding protein [Sporolactobacillus mangiferae]